MGVGVDVGVDVGVAVGVEVGVGVGVGVDVDVGVAVGVEVDVGVRVSVAVGVATSRRLITTGGASPAPVTSPGVAGMAGADWEGSGRVTMKTITSNEPSRTTVDR